VLVHWATYLKRRRRLFGGFEISFNNEEYQNISQRNEP
jgi:hypothetical protein